MVGLSVTIVFLPLNSVLMSKLQIIQVNIQLFMFRLFDLSIRRFVNLCFRNHNSVCMGSSENFIIASMFLSAEKQFRITLL